MALDDIEQPVSTLDQLRRERDVLRRQLGDGPPDPTWEYRRLFEEHERQGLYRDESQWRLDTARGQLDKLGPVGRRTHRRQRRELEGRIAGFEADTTRHDEKLGELQAQLRAAAPSMKIRVDGSVSTAATTIGSPQPRAGWTSRNALDELLPGTSSAVSSEKSVSSCERPGRVPAFADASSTGASADREVLMGSSWLAGATVAERGVFVPAKPTRHAADLLISAEGVTLTAKDRSVQLPWDDSKPALFGRPVTTEVCLTLPRRSGWK